MKRRLELNRCVCKSVVNWCCQSCTGPWWCEFGVRDGGEIHAAGKISHRFGRDARSSLFVDHHSHSIVSIPFTQFSRSFALPTHVCPIHSLVGVVGARCARKHHQHVCGTVRGVGAPAGAVRYCIPPPPPDRQHQFSAQRSCQRASHKWYILSTCFVDACVCGRVRWLVGWLVVMRRSCRYCTGYWVGLSL